MENSNWIFSPSESRFYYVGLHDLYEKNDNWPADAVDVTDDVRAQFNTPPEGKMLGTEGGIPAWVDVPPQTTEQLIAQAEQQKAALKVAADAEIEWRKYAVDKGVATDEESTALDEWSMYRVLLMRVDTSKAPDLVWPTPPDVPAS